MSVSEQSKARRKRYLIKRIQLFHHHNNKVMEKIYRTMLEKEFGEVMPYFHSEDDSCRSLYVCPKCKTRVVYEGFHFCPMCGVRFQELWDVSSLRFKEKMFSLSMVDEEASVYFPPRKAKP